MARLQDLHELVHSMPMSEKRFVRQYINGLGAKARDRYNSDLDVILSQEQYNKEKLKIALARKNKSSNLSEANTNLYNCLCQALSLYQRNNFPVLGFLNRIEVAEMLKNKGLMDQASNYTEKLIAEAEEKNYNSLLHRLFELRSQIQFHLSPRSSTYDWQLSNYHKQISLLDKHRNYLQYLELKSQLYKMVHLYGTPRKQEHLDAYLELRNHPLFSNPEEALSDRALYEYYSLKAILLYLDFNYDQSYELSKEALGVIRERFDRSTNPRPDYYTSMRLLEDSVQTGDRVEVQHWLDNFEESSSFVQEEGLVKKVRAKKDWVWLSFAVKVEDFEEGYRYLIEDAEFTDPIYDKYNPQNYIIHLLAARICFIAGDYQRSLDHVQHILNQADRIRQTLLTATYCLNLLNHYKLGNDLFLPYAVRNLYRNLIGLEELYPPERALLTYIRKVAQNPVSDHEGFTIELYEQFREMIKDDFHRPFFSLGDYMFWLESEIHSLKEK